jgi:hypothetical protein
VYDYRGLNAILAYGTYNEIETTQSHTIEWHHALDIIKAGNRAKGIMITPVGNYIIGNSEKRTYTGLIKGQVSGGGTATYFLMEDVLRALDRNPDIIVHMPLDGYFSIGDAPKIRIDSSPCLVDPDIPLRYSIQNAFDGDPATSYVENSEDDLMDIYFSGIKADIDVNKIAIINGYAQNITLYKKNNRLKTVSSLLDNITELEDNNMNYQIIHNISLSLRVQTIYKGDTYNDTCIAELDFFSVNDWLFGGTNE